MSDQIVVDFRTEPARYKHWKLAFDGPVATLAMDVREDGGLVPGYELKLNSYDLGVDIELYDAIQRLRFEHPEVGAVVLTHRFWTTALQRDPDAALAAIVAALASVGYGALGLGSACSSMQRPRRKA